MAVFEFDTELSPGKGLVHYSCQLDNFFTLGHKCITSLKYTKNYNGLQRVLLFL